MARTRALGTPAQRAAAGAKFLDDNVSDTWFRRISLNTLDIGSNSCIIGQLNPERRFELEWLVQFGVDADNDNLLGVGLQYGFRMNGEDDREPLTVAWATEVNARIEGVKAAKKAAKAAVKAAADDDSDADE